MSKNSVEFKGDDSKALEYIRMRGYASYSSLVMVRDCLEPQPPSDAKHFVFGKELHSRVLENKQLQKLDKDQELQLKSMTQSLQKDAVVKKLLNGARTEVKFHQQLMGVMVLGYIDILNFAVADLKTTRHTNLKNFASSMDFLQAVLYLAVTGKKDFYYIGICKQAPFNTMVFNVRQYPTELARKEKELKELLQYLKKKL